MGLLYFVALAVFLGLAHGQDSTDSCPPTVPKDQYLFANNNNQKCYRFQLSAQEDVDYDQANYNCTNQGGQLVTIKDQATQDFIVDSMTQGLQRGSKIWLGFNDRASPGNKVWVDGTPVSYSNFAADWVQGQHKHCGAMEPGDHQNNWDMAQCTKTKRFICEFDFVTAGTTADPAIG